MQVLVIVLLMYAVSPFDFITELIPVLAVFADFIVLPLLIWLCLKAVPQDVSATLDSWVQGRSMCRAAEEDGMGGGGGPGQQVVTSQK
jgi:uncharacterized membrane protein YkvA (DUF1232 family)